MATTDEYAFLSSNSPQSVGAVSPYTEKNYNNINDINAGVYSASNTLVQFDLSSIYNSSLMTDTSDAFLTIPLVMVAQCSSGVDAANQALRAPPNAAQSLLTLKNGFHHLVHQVEIQSGGQVIQNIQPFNNVIKGFKLMSTMTETDLKQLGSSYGMADCLDSETSQKWFTVAGKANDGATDSTGFLPGVGLTNNQAFLSGTVPYSGDQKVCATQDAFTCNEALQKRIARVTSLQRSSVATAAAASATLGSNIYGATQSANARQPVIMTANELQLEFKPHFVVSGDSAVWYDLAVIPVKFLADCFRSIGLCKKLDMQMRLYLNTGSVVVPVGFPAAAGGLPQYGVPTSSTFSNTCPFTVNTIPLVKSIAGGATTDGFNVSAAGDLQGYVCAGVYVARPPVTSIAAGGSALQFNLASGVTGNMMQSCRLYYSQIKLDPAKALAYEQDNRAKLCVYEDYIYNQYNGIPAGGNFSQLVQSGIRNPLAMCIVPFISGSTPTLVGGGSTLGFSQFASPFDTSPATYSAVSLSSLQVALGGQNVLKSGALQYSFENFLEQVAIADSVVAGVGPANVGLIEQAWWEQNRVYWVDLSRGSDADKASMRNLTVTFRNNSQVVIDVMIFTIYSSQITVDVTNGRTTLF